MNSDQNKGERGMRTDELFSSNVRSSLADIQHKFEYLISDYGFAVTHIEEQKSPHWLIGLESSLCRAKFEYHVGVPEICLGRLSARFRWGAPPNDLEWFSVHKVIRFLSGKAQDPETSAKLPREIAHLPPREQIRSLSEPHRTQSDIIALANEFKPVATDALQLFKQDDDSRRWRAFCEFYLERPEEAPE